MTRWSKEEEAMNATVDINTEEASSKLWRAACDLVDYESWRKIYSTLDGQPDTLGTEMWHYLVKDL